MFFTMVTGMMKMWPDRCTSLAKRELMYFGIFGPACLLCGIIFIDRLNREKALGTMDRAAKLINEERVRPVLVVTAFHEGYNRYTIGHLGFPWLF